MFVDGGGEGEGGVFEARRRGRWRGGGGDGGGGGGCVYSSARFSSNLTSENLPVPELLNMHSSLTRSNPPVLVCGVSWESGGS